MTQRLGLIVTDASALITLGAAGALSCLLMPGVPVLVPDMVYAEVTRDMTRLGADEIVDWLRANREQVQIVATAVYAEFETLRQANPPNPLTGSGRTSRRRSAGRRNRPRSHAARFAVVRR